MGIPTGVAEPPEKSILLILLDFRQLARNRSRNCQTPSLASPAWLTYA